MNTDSYDLELGPFFWRYTSLVERQPARMARGEGFELEDARDNAFNPLDGAGIWLQPGERVLGHTVEIAGGRVAGDVAVTTHLQATSTAGRHGITACECAGYGDVGFWNIWVLEITNNTRDAMFLPVGAIIAQVAFTQVAVPGHEYGQITGNYQPRDVSTPDDVRRAWRPEHMLPKTLKVRNGWRDESWTT